MELILAQIIGWPGALWMIGTGLGFCVAWNLWLPIVAARTVNLWWGIGIFLFSPLGIVFAILHWPHAKRPMICAGVFFGLAVFMFVLRAGTSLYLLP